MVKAWSKELHLRLYGSPRYDSEEFEGLNMIQTFSVFRMSTFQKSMMEKYILISNYANDNVVYAFSLDLEEVHENLNQELLKFFEWSYEN